MSRSTYIQCRQEQREREIAEKAERAKRPSPAERLKRGINRASILAELHHERERQEVKHGVRNAEERARMSPREAYLHYKEILGEEIGEVANAYLENDPVNIRKELVQSAAVIVAMLEYGDKDGWFKKGGADR